MTTINGHRISLDDKRSVFLGHHEGDYVIQFVNADSDPAETLIRLTPEAMDALVKLYDGRHSTDWARVFDIVIRTVAPEKLHTWQVDLSAGDAPSIQVADQASMDGEGGSRISARADQTQNSQGNSNA